MHPVLSIISILYVVQSGSILDPLIEINYAHSPHHQFIEKPSDSFSDSICANPAKRWDYHPLVSITSEVDLYANLRSVTSRLFMKVNDESVHCPHSITIHYRNQSIPLFIINRTMVRNPYLIAQNIVEILHHWYEYQHCKNNLYHDKYSKFSLLVVLLRNFLETCNRSTFGLLHKLLDSLFKDRKGFRIWLFYRWLFFEPYIGFISNHTLKVVAKIGEGSQGIVFKVRGIYYGDVFALKLFKGAFQPFEVWNDCRPEENILLKINGIHDYNERKLLDSISVPRLITRTKDDVEIQCKRHRALLMEFIQREKSIKYIFTETEAKEMYFQLLGTITTLAKFGISHDDMNHGNVIFDGSKWWLCDFGLALDVMDIYRGETKANVSGDNVTILARRTPIIATWFYMSPSIWQLSKLLIDGHFVNNFGHDEIQMATSLIIEGNTYSLQALVLDMLPFMQDPMVVRQVALMDTFGSRIQYIWFKHGRKKWDAIGANLAGIWKVRARIVHQHLKGHADREFVDIFSLLMRKRWNGRICDHIRLLLNSVDEKDGGSEIWSENDGLIVRGKKKNTRCSGCRCYIM